MNDQGKEVSVKLDDALIFQAEMVGEAINPHWTIQGRTTGTGGLRCLSIDLYVGREIRIKYK